MKTTTNQIKTSGRNSKNIFLTAIAFVFVSLFSVSNLFAQDVEVIVSNVIQAANVNSLSSNQVCIMNTNIKLKDRYNISVTSSNGYKVELSDQNNNKTMAIDTNGDGNWDFVASHYDTDGNG